MTCITKVIGVVLVVFFVWLNVFGANNKCLAQISSPTILPTDTVPFSSHREQAQTGNALQLRLWQRLPAAFYFTGTIESTFRIETNPFQYPMKRTLLQELLPVGTDISNESPSDITSINQEISHASALDQVHRVNPTLSAGWAITPNTQVFGTYFLIRDSLFHNSQINSTTQAVGIGAQHNFSLGSKTTLQPQIIARELWQTDQPAVIDYLPAINLQTNLTPNLVAYLNALLQLRFIHFIGDPMRELDPMYTAGLVYQRGKWTFIATGTFLQNIRKPFGINALIPVNNNSIILDFEIDRQLFKKLPGLQAVMRVEPVYNFDSKNTLGISGMDFRFYYGLRMSTFKPWLTGSMQQLRQRYQMLEEPNP